MILKIDGKEIEIKNKMRAILIYEQITDKTFAPTSLTDILVYFYSLMLANDPKSSVTFDKFMDYIDDNPDVVKEFQNWVVEQNRISEHISNVKKKEMVTQ